ncbi:MAG: hypothetical protein VB087_07995 [Candidatus Limiplasma sp.]|nr:hypothetical protein [Candidatus Limiplasma sp.]MEA5144909.1 hypothetical protein [Candidatus Limiplasma sp.]
MRSQRNDRLRFFAKRPPMSRVAVPSADPLVNAFRVAKSKDDLIGFACALSAVALTQAETAVIIAWAASQFSYAAAAKAAGLSGEQKVRHVLRSCVIRLPKDSPYLGYPDVQLLATIKKGAVNDSDKAIIDAWILNGCNANATDKYLAVPPGRTNWVVRKSYYYGSTGADAYNPNGNAQQVYAYAKQGAITKRETQIIDTWHQHDFNARQAGIALGITGRSVRFALLDCAFRAGLRDGMAACSQCGERRAAVKGLCFRCYKSKTKGGD